MVRTAAAALAVLAVFSAVCDAERHRRASIPCGSSFTPCNRRPFGEVSQDQPLEVQEPGQTVTAPNIRRQILQTAVKEAKDEQDLLFNQTDQRSLQPGFSDQSEVGRLLDAFTKSDTYARDLSFPALVSIGASQRLRNLGLKNEEIVFGLPKMALEETVLEKICPPNQVDECVPGKYRTFSGYCNNVNNPFWGASFAPLQRFVSPDYADEVSHPRRAADTSPLPNPRLVSSTIFIDRSTPHKSSSLMVMQWAQFIYYDMAQLSTFKAGETLKPISCCNPNLKHPECLPIEVPEADPIYGGVVNCLPYVRTTTTPRENCLLGPREQANMVTSFLDGSSIYGSSGERAEQLRSKQDGKLKSSKVPFIQDLMEAIPFSSENCRSSVNQPCFLSGSEQANLLPTLTAVHTIWFRQHNRLASKLKDLNPQWDDERLYQEARRLVVAQIQHITFNEFLPVVIGGQNIQKYGLNLRLEGYYSDYDLKVDPATLNGFASAVGLFFYTLMPSSIGFYDKNGGKSNEKPLSELFYNPGSLYFKDKLDGILRFLLRERSESFDTDISGELTSKFLKGSNSIGLDLAAMIVQMGRDHGLPGYNAYRTQCGLRKPSSFADLQEELRDPTIIEKLQKLYKTVDDVDLFVLGLAEKPARGALVGPTFACLLGRQFQKIRRGDRFWYENFFFPSLYTNAQLDEIRKTTLARVICDNSDDIGDIQPFVMMVEDKYENCVVQCNSTVIETLDLSPWADSEPRHKLPITEDTLRKAIRLGAERVKEKLKKESEQIRLNDPGDIAPNSGSLFLHNTLMSPRQESIDISRSADVFLETTRVLIRGDQLGDGEKLPKELDTRTLQKLLPQIDVTSFIANATGNTEQCNPKPFPCDHTSPYRTFTGWCNNLKFPQYGNAFGSFRRLLEPVYNDGFSEPRTFGVGGKPLPTARAVANAIHASPEIVHVRYTHMLMQYAQILDHDMTHAPVSLGPDKKMLNCSRCDSPETVSSNCFPIAIPENDPFFPPKLADGRPRCMPFVRSLIGQLSLGYREQINQLTAFLDSSPVYGSYDCQANDLRLFSQGKLNFTTKSEGLQHGLPQGFKEPDCRTLPKLPCFVAGDSRVNEQTGLAVMHTVLLREHNRIAERLHRINNFWTDERIYQETRKILGAVNQHIVYNEFLPKLLGCQAMDKYGLRLKKTGYYTGYDEHCDASVSNEFATAAFRFGHTLIRATFVRMDDFYHNLTSPIRLRTMFMNNSVLYDSNEGGVEAMLIGLIGAPAMEFDRYINEDLRHHLFEKANVPFSGMDLPALNVQRARDHGIPGYNFYRELCGLPRARTFSDLSDVIDNEAIADFQSVYAHVDDIDLFPGIMAEKASPGGLIGHTGACIIGEQFNRLRRCDRFWYENDLPGVRFSPGQLAEIRKASLAKVVCANSQFLRLIQPKVFDMPDELLNAQVPCQDLPDIDLYQWLDRQFCVVDHRVINLGKTKRITPCVSCTCTAEGPECHAVRVESCSRLVDEFLFSEIAEDTVCIIQCSGLIKERNGRL